MAVRHRRPRRLKLRACVLRVQMSAGALTRRGEVVGSRHFSQSLFRPIAMFFLLLFEITKAEQLRPNYSEKTEKRKRWEGSFF